MRAPDDVHRQFGKRLGNRVKQAQTVLGFNLDERARLGSLVVKMDLRRHAFAGVGLINRAVGDLARDERGQVNVLAGQNFFQQLGKFVVLLARGRDCRCGRR